MAQKEGWKGEANIIGLNELYNFIMAHPAPLENVKPGDKVFAMFEHVAERLAAPGSLWKNSGPVPRVENIVCLALLLEGEVKCSVSTLNIVLAACAVAALMGLPDSERKRVVVDMDNGAVLVATPVAARAAYPAHAILN